MSLTMTGMVTRVAEETLAQYALQLRGNLGLSDVVRRVNLAITTTAIANIESGATKRPKDTTLRTLSLAYGTDEEDQQRIYRRLLRLAGYDVLELPGIGPVAAPQSREEASLMERYRALDPDDKEALERFLGVLERRYRLDT